MSNNDLTPIGDSGNMNMSLEELAQHQPKPVSDTDRKALVGMAKADWYEIVQWLQLRMSDATKWDEVYIDVWYSDLKDYTKADVFNAVRSLYEDGRVKAPEGSLIVARLKELSVPKVHRPNQSTATLNNFSGGVCKSEGIACSFIDRRWVPDEYGNQSYYEACMSKDKNGELCEELRPTVPNESEVRLKPTKSTKGELYPTLVNMGLSLEMKRAVWKRYAKYPDGNIEEMLKQYGKATWYE
tara:strand:- start:8385 stop:9107 length:723 start_codon:yes stop_codon:yes gene_type:complete